MHDFKSKGLRIKKKKFKNEGKYKGENSVCIMQKLFEVARKLNNTLKFQLTKNFSLISFGGSKVLAFNAVKREFSI